MRPANLLCNSSVYVGNLAWDLTNQDLENAFAKFGPIERAKINTDRDTGQGAGQAPVGVGRAGVEWKTSALSLAAPGGLGL